MKKAHSTKRSTTEEFIKKAVELHGDAYDYSEVVYENNRTYVKIYCKKHQEFFMQKPNVHLNGAGCKKCGYEKNSNTRAMKLDEFIKRSIEKYGKDKFDYSLVEYKNSSTKVKIICNLHGEFEVTPHNFLASRTVHGCYQCGRESIQTLQQTNFKFGKNSKYPIGVSSTTDEFIKKAKDRFGDRFDYSKVEYIRSDQRVIIICPVHGEFLQSPNTHLTHQGCPFCSKEHNALKRRLDISEFIDKANLAHNFKYDYSKVEYKGSTQDVTIICPEHGEFRQNPSTHINAKSGCPKCGAERIGFALKKTPTQFIDKANQVHNFKYDYSKINYQGNKTKVEIICPTHGSFWQKPNDHTGGHGCRLCAYELQDMSYSDRFAGCKTTFYVIKYKNKYKIGITTKSILERYKQEVESPSDIDIIHNIEFDSPDPALELETLLLNKYHKHKYKGNNIFKKTNNTEVFNIDVYSIYLEDLKNGR